MEFHNPAGLSNEAVRTALYGGSIIRIPANESSLKLVADVVALIQTELADDDIRTAQFRLGNDKVLERTVRIRSALSTEARFRTALLDLIESAAFKRNDNAFDPLRLRSVMHLGHDNPQATPAYSAHRDTWYANPQAQINWWMPLHDVTEDETFSFFRAYFGKAIDNTSAQFDYDSFMAKVGWQATNRPQTAVYPTATEGRLDPITGESFACSMGDLILFSAAHLHQSKHHASGKTRFSLDFRTVHVGDHKAGLGAANVDNKSTGNAFKDYLNGQG